MSKDGTKKTRPHNANTLIIVRLISPMVQLFNVYNVLKLNIHEGINLVTNMHKIVNKLF